MTYDDKYDDIKYADDTVVYCSGKDTETIENTLSQDMELIAKYFDENELVMNLKEGKTEVMLFGTRKRLSTQSHKIKVKYKSQDINLTKSYTYLGYKLDPSLTFSDNFDTAYKKASNRLRLLSKLREHLTSTAATRIFQMMIVPIITYSGMVKLSLTKIQLRKLDSIERRAQEIIGNDVYIPHLDKLIKKKACVVVRKCLDKEICNNFQEYFKINELNCGTRNNGIMLKLTSRNLTSRIRRFSACSQFQTMYIG